MWFSQMKRVKIICIRVLLLLIVSMYGSASTQLYNQYIRLYPEAQCSVCSYLVVCGTFVWQDTKSAVCHKREWTRWGWWRRICLKPLRFARTCPWPYFTGGEDSNCLPLIFLLIQKRKYQLFILLWMFRQRHLLQFFVTVTILSYSAS